MPLRDSLAMLPTLTARPDHNLATLRRLVFAGDTAPTALAMRPRVHQGLLDIQTTYAQTQVHIFRYQAQQLGRLMEEAMKNLQPRR